MGAEQIEQVAVRDVRSAMLSRESNFGKLTIAADLRAGFGRSHQLARAHEARHVIQPERMADLVGDCIRYVFDKL